MADVFISYERSDRAHAENIAAVLERKGWSVWWDRKLLAGETFGQTIQDALTSARCVIVLWSRTSVVSSWVKDEATDGARRGILIPVLIDDVEIPLGFRQIHAIGIAEGATAAQPTQFSDLVTAVARFLHAPPSAPSAGHSAAIPDRQRGSAAGSRRQTLRRLYVLAPAIVIALVVFGIALRQCRSERPDTSASAPRSGDRREPQSPPAVVARPEAAPRQSKTDEKAPVADTQPMGIVVAGTGQDLYYVFDATGEKQLTAAFTNRATELFPGSYTIALNGVRRAITVETGHQTVVEAGTVVVRGIGKDLYRVFDAAGAKQLGAAFTNHAIELLPGSYRLALNNVQQPTGVAAKRETVVEAGTITVSGTGKDLYYVFDSSGQRQLAAAFTNNEIELFPGPHVIVLNQVKRPGQVTAGRKTTIDR